MESKWVGTSERAPVVVDEEAVVLLPVHRAGHRGPVDGRDAEGLEDVGRAGEALEPDDLCEADLALVVELEHGLEREVAGVGLLERIVGRGGVAGHGGDALDAEGDAEQGEDHVGHVGQVRGRVGRGVVDERDKDVLGAELLAELDSLQGSQFS